MPRRSTISISGAVICILSDRRFLKRIFLQISIDQAEYLTCITLQNDPWNLCNPVKGELYVAIFLVIDPIAKVLCYFCSVSSGNIHNDTGFASFFLIFQQEIVHCRILLCQNTRTDCRVSDKTFHLFWGEVPDSIDLFSLKYARRDIISDRPVCQTSEQHKMVDQIIVASVFHVFPLSKSIPAGLDNIIEPILNGINLK